jgi:hypothetical protein
MPAHFAAQPIDVTTPAWGVFVLPLRGFATFRAVFKQSVTPGIATPGATPPGQVTVRVRPNTAVGKRAMARTPKEFLKNLMMKECIWSNA